MEIKQKETSVHCFFYIEENEKRIAHISYIYEGTGKFIIKHTIVEPGYEGKGLGKKLVNAAVDFARHNNLKIVPVCPYAKKVLESASEYKDILTH